MAKDNASQSGNRSPLLGDHVRIRLGTLAGLTGMVVGFTPASSCILKVDGLADGVRVIVVPDVLEPSDQQKSAR